MPCLEAEMWGQWNVYGLDNVTCYKQPFCVNLHSKTDEFNA